MSTLTVLDLVKICLNDAGPGDIVLYQSKFPIAYGLLNSAATNILSLGTYTSQNINTIFNASLIAAVFTLVENQDDNGVAIDGPLTLISTTTGLTRTILTQSDLDAVMSRDISLDTNYEKFIVSYLTLISCSVYMTLCITSHTIEDLYRPLPTYYNVSLPANKATGLTTIKLSNFTPKDLRGIMVRIGIDSVTNQNQKNSMACEILNLGLLIDFTKFKLYTDGITPCVAQTTCEANPTDEPCNIMFYSSTDPNVQIYTKVLLIGLYYYSWVGLNIFKIT